MKPPNFFFIFFLNDSEFHIFVIRNRQLLYIFIETSQFQNSEILFFPGDVDSTFSFIRQYQISCLLLSIRDL